MRRIAIFVEGQTELIFVRDLLLKLIDPSKLSLECWELLAHRQRPAHYSYSCPNPNIHFMIVGVHGDGAVLSAIREKERKLMEESGYERIIGLRDMYSEAYRKLSPRQIDEGVSNNFIESHNLTIQTMTYRDRIKLYFAVMETEAWFLAMYNIFQKIDKRLNAAFIKQNLGMDLKNIDPQKSFFRPTEQVQKIFSLCNRRYDKSEHQVNSITSRMQPTDFEDARENNRCSYFNDFYQDLMTYA